MKCCIVDWKLTGRNPECWGWGEKRTIGRGWINVVECCVVDWKANRRRNDLIRLDVIQNNSRKTFRTKGRRDLRQTEEEEKKAKAEAEDMFAI